MWLSIDFGTSFTRASLMRDGKLEMIPLGDNSPAMPSTIFLTDSGQMLVGQEADNNRLRAPERYRSEFKRHLGTNTPLSIGGKSFLPEHLIRHVLNVVKTKAERHTSQSLKRAVLTVPVTYAPHKRELMEQAALEVGFERVLLLNEPEAAARYYAWRNRLTGQSLQDGQNVLVFDFGGGTFDTVLLRKEGAQYKFVGEPDGLPECGGIDCDRKIYEDVRNRASNRLKELLDSTNTTPSGFRTRLHVGEQCRELKHKLSDLQRAEVDDLLPGSLTDSYTLTRSDLNKMIDPFVQQAMQTCLRMLRNAGITWSEVQQILLVGGSCRIPLVRETIERVSQRPVLFTDEPELAVCRGAAIHGDNERNISLATNPLFTENNFKDTFQAFSEQLGIPVVWKNDRHATLSIEMESGRVHRIHFFRFDDTLEFSIQTSHKSNSLNQLPHLLSSALAKMSSKTKYGFWCVEELEDKHVYSIMHNVELQLIDIELFGKLIIALVMKCEAFENLMSQSGSIESKVTKILASM